MSATTDEAWSVYGSALVSVGAAGFVGGGVLGAGGELFSVIRKAHRLPNDTAQVWWPS
jgi:hypothetical protein